MPSPACRNDAPAVRISPLAVLSRGDLKDHLLTSGCQILVLGIRLPAMPVHLGENREAAVCRGSGIQLEDWGFLLSEADLPLDSDKLHKVAHTVAA